MKINSTSLPFQSTYIFNHKSLNGKKSSKSEKAVTNYCIQKRIKHSTKYSMSHDGLFYTLNAKQTVNMPDSMDNEFETFCANKNISYTKLDTKNLLDETSIIARMEKPEDVSIDSRLALLDVSKFDDIYKNQHSSRYDFMKSTYENLYKDKAMQLLLSGDEIPTPVASISENYEGAAQDVANKKITENIKYALNIDVENDENNIYFALLEQGLTQFPVTVDDDTYEIGMKLGVFKN